MIHYKEDNIIHQQTRDRNKLIQITSMTFCLTNCGGGRVGGVDRGRGGGINAGSRSKRAFMHGCDGTQELIRVSGMSASNIAVSNASTGSPLPDTAVAMGNFASTNVLDLEKFYQRQLKEMEMEIKMASVHEQLNHHIMKTSRSSTLGESTQDQWAED
jgi:hypothetical protein